MVHYSNKMSKHTFEQILYNYTSGQTAFSATTVIELQSFVTNVCPFRNLNNTIRLLLSILLSTLMSNSIHVRRLFHCSGKRTRDMLAWSYIAFKNYQKRHQIGICLDVTKYTQCFLLLLKPYL